MPRTEEAQWWYEAVYSTIQLIPRGQCTTYGHIALILGFPQRARQVGVCLKHLPSFEPAHPDGHFYHDQNVPWQRVVNAKGGISPRGDGGSGANRQVQALRREGILVNDQTTQIAESWVDLGRYGWFPSRIPGRGEGDDDDDDDEE
jgi:methylated-DNA-protein-cysteine methyltransferase related protein